MGRSPFRLQEQNPKGVLAHELNVDRKNTSLPGKIHWKSGVEVASCRLGYLTTDTRPVVPSQIQQDPMLHSGWKLAQDLHDLIRWCAGGGVQRLKRCRVKKEMSSASKQPSWPQDGSVAEREMVRPAYVPNAMSYNGCY